MNMPGPMEWVIILVVVLIIFGPGKLPQLGRSLGSMLSEFKSGAKGKSESEPDSEKEPEEKQ